VLGLTVWRVRLRPITAVLNVASLSSMSAGGQPVLGSLIAHVSARPAFTSIPLSRGWFLPSTPRTERISLTVTDIPADVKVGATIELTGLLTAGDDSWTVPLTLRYVVLDGDRAVVAITGAIPRGSASPLHMIPMRIDVAAEFSRWV
jgi:hypothetical protein